MTLTRLRKRRRRKPGLQSNPSEGVKRRGRETDFVALLCLELFPKKLLSRPFLISPSFSSLSFWHFHSFLFLCKKRNYSRFIKIIGNIWWWNNFFLVPWYGAWRGLDAGDEDLCKQESDGEHFFFTSPIHLIHPYTTVSKTALFIIKISSNFFPKSQITSFHHSTICTADASTKY